MILSRGDKYWHGSCGMRFEGTEGWVACADSYKQAGGVVALPCSKTATSCWPTTWTARSAR